MKTIGLLFGSFNPIHLGHLIIAESVVDQPDITEVWFVVSPQNPFKEKSSLLNQYARLDLVKLAIEDNYRLKASNIEFGLPQPSYTITTLTYLQEKYPDYKFFLVIGEDNLVHFHKWKNHEKILKYFGLIVYPRIGDSVTTYDANPSVQKMKVPYIGISATQIRKAIKNKKSFRYLVPEKVHEAIGKASYYRSK